MDLVLTRTYYKYDGVAKKCWLIAREQVEGKRLEKPLGDYEILRELPLVKSNSFKQVFIPDGSGIMGDDGKITADEESTTLTIEHLTVDNIIEISLRNVKRAMGTVDDWPLPFGVDDLHSLPPYNNDFVVWNPEIRDYELKDNWVKKMFVLYTDKYDKTKPIYFWFDYWLHLVWKDKDEERGWYWYRWDYEGHWNLNEFIYQTLSPHIKKEDGEIIAIPGEKGGGVFEWQENGYKTNYSYYEIYDDKEEWEEKKDWYDFAYETWERWNRIYKTKPALIISFFPTGVETHKPKKQRLTGTKWFLKLWEVFGQHGVPIVIRTYEGFIYKQLYTNHREYYDKISAITRLPKEISNVETGSAKLLVYWNCPFLGDGAKSEVKWNPEFNKKRKYIKNEHEFKESNG